MPGQEVVEKWLKNEDQTYRVLERAEFDWRLEVEYPRTSAFWITVGKLHEKETYLVYAGVQLDPALQEKADNRDRRRFLAQLKRDFLRLRVQYRLDLQGEENTILSTATFFDPMFGDEMSMGSLYHCLADIHRAALLCMVHLELLQLETEGRV